MDDTEGLTHSKLQRRTTMRDKVNETVEKSWRSVTTGLGRVLETKFTNTLVIILLAVDVCIVVADLLIKLYRREYPEHYNELNKTDHVLRWVIFGLRTFYLVMIVVRVSSFGGIYLADPLNLFDAFIVFLAAIFYYMFKENDKVISSFFILCRFWRINRVLEFSEQLKKDKHEKNYKSLQRRMTTRLEGERDINAKLHKQKEKKNQVKFQGDNDKKDKDDNEVSYLSEFEQYFHF
ncbi:hypothetical protein H8356DRAFT_1283437 [Neocallimastix lanati (nom. inval.)]|uniref:Voltage-gated hydrogen channel 1 n=1 Tax=Neocallimastix californiae TaxID=1754190 RepID=A0A1Y2AJS2_9FUNG|nr:hypothetical protein H8356DRAFT_1283437 [Neocallimastix sp. JGI-2020a]ORY22744.1 hypothetical protein LY90DRAFT_675785 [Neocallimastix californiae]|eukprot:ORY22744.1 hypothetical protein LY90DRAFT_675785 [Neocallimastix californiae]